MTQAERDRLVALKKAKKKRMTQKQAAEEIGIAGADVIREEFAFPAELKLRERL